MIRWGERSFAHGISRCTPQGLFTVPLAGAQSGQRWRSAPSSAVSFETLERLAIALQVPASALLPASRLRDGTRSREPQRRARQIAAMTELARSFDDGDLALAQALITAAAESVSDTARPFAPLTVWRPKCLLYIAFY